MAKLSLTNVIMNDVSCSAKQKLMTVEHSSLRSPRFERLYDDACDVGICFHSPLTGKNTVWFLSESETVRDADNDIMHWVLRPTVETVRLNKQLDGWKIIMYND